LIDDCYGRTDAAKIGNNRSNQQIALPGHLLAYALQLKDFAIVQLLCESVIDVQSRDQSGNTALHLAIRTRDVRYVAELLQSREEFPLLDLNVHKDSHGWTPLMLASAGGDQSIVELLLQAGASCARPVWIKSKRPCYVQRLATLREETDSFDCQQFNGWTQCWSPPSAETIQREVIPVCHI